LLNIIAGLEIADTGKVMVDGEDISATPVHRRDFGFMFQELALFPHMNARDNIAFGLRMAGTPPDRTAARVNEVLALVGLSGFGHRNVNELSGGEQQRVALARSLAPQPRLLMLDEPLSSLDRALRERLLNEIRDILQRIGQTAIYVTHDQQEAFSLAHRIVIMNQGRIAQIGKPQHIYLHPQNDFVARFLGYTNLLPGTIKAGSTASVETSLGVLQFSHQACDAGDVTVLIRPEAYMADSHVNMLHVRLVDVSYRGRYNRVTVQVNNLALELDVDQSIVLPEIGEAFDLSLNPEAISCIGQSQ
jgi:ABC-type Fe3+/spermidine/putrescine transport system ATPase subunit